MIYIRTVRTNLYEPSNTYARSEGWKLVPVPYWNARSFYTQRLAFCLCGFSCSTLRFFHHCEYCLLVNSTATLQFANNLTSMLISMIVIPYSNKTYLYYPVSLLKNRRYGTVPYTPKSLNRINPVEAIIRRLGSVLVRANWVKVNIKSTPLKYTGTQ